MTILRRQKESKSRTRSLLSACPGSRFTCNAIMTMVSVNSR